MGNRLSRHFELGRGRVGILLLIATVLSVAISSAWAVENRGVISPVGPGTVPPSSLRSGLIRSPNPIDSSGNLIITGNVTGGRYFHGPVPYRSTTDFGAPLGSGALSSFLRDSASSDSFDRYIERYRAQPYYSPTETVTTTTPGRSGVFMPSNTRIAERAPDTFGVEDLQKKEIAPGQEIAVPDTRLRSTLLTTEQIKKLAAEATTKYPPSERMAAEQYQEQMEELQRELLRLREKAKLLEQKAGQKDTSLETSAKAMTEQIAVPQLQQPGILEIQPAEKEVKQPLTFEPAAPPQPQEPIEKSSSTEKERARTSDIYERLKQQIEKTKSSQPKEKTSEVPQEDLKKLTGAGQTGKTATAGTQLSKEESYFEAPGKKQRQDIEGYSRTLGALEPEETSEGKISALKEVEQLSPKQASAEAKRILGPYKTYEAFSAAKFDQYIAAAQMYQKQGKYYRAADSYAMALIYKANDPTACAGRGHMLFAAGEYVSSALFLARAIEASSGYAQTKVDLVALLGDKDLVESRIADVEAWLQRSDAPVLRFLLGYVYYRTGRLDRAKDAIDSAYDKMPNSVAVQAVRKAIDDAMRSQKTK